MDLIKASRLLSLVLRHKPEAAGINLDKHGWANVNELLKEMSKKYLINMNILEEIVATDDKQRYSFNEDKTLIRANQGHSVDVDVELKEAAPPEFLWHGTGEKYAKSIELEGLLSKSRLYVHLSADIDTAKNVGARHGVPVVYRINAQQMHIDGYKFYMSENGVWLTKYVPACYLNKWF